MQQIDSSRQIKDTNITGLELEELTDGSTTELHTHTFSGGGGTPAGSDSYIQYNDGGVFGGSQYLSFDDTTIKLIVGGNVESHFPLDQPLTASDTAASHFEDYAASYPTGWTETATPVSTNTTQERGFWFLRGSSITTSWDYKRQTGVTIESLGANTYASFRWGPIVFKDGGYTADLDYYFGIYGHTAGAIDLNKFSRVNLHWSSGSSIWQVRGECKDGTTQTNSTYKTISYPYVPMYFRTLLRNSTAFTMVQYAGANMFTRTLTNLQIVNGTVTWGQVWARLHMSRGAGATDDIYIGALDYEGNVG